jgi:transcriptional regulator with XRE-family HTH domain
MTPAEIGRLTGYSPTTINDYLTGRRCPSRRFLLDLLDKVPLADYSFQEIAPLLGIRRGKCPQPSRYHRKPLHEYLSALRVSLRRTRDQFAAKLGVTVDEVTAVEHGHIPNSDYFKRLSQVLPDPITVDAVIATFPVLRPTPLDNKLRHNLEKARLHPTVDPQRRILENALAADLAPEARRMALNAAWKIRRPEYAEEVWGEAVALTIRRHDPQKGLMLAYLNSSIHGLIRALVAGNRHTGTATILRDYGETVREAEEFLFDRLGRLPSDDEVALHTDLRASLIGEIQRARAACVHVGGGELDFLLQQAVDILPSESAAESELTRRLRDMPDDWREIIYLHFHDRLSLAEIMAVANLTEDAVFVTINAAVTLLQGNPEASHPN